MGLLNIFKKKGVDLGLVININNKIPYSKRKGEFGKPISSIISQFYKQNAIQYFQEGEEKYLTGFRIMGSKARFDKNKEVIFFKQILNEIIIFLKNKKIKFTIDLYTPKPFKEEAFEWALGRAEEIERKKLK